MEPSMTHLNTKDSIVLTFKMSLSEERDDINVLYLSQELALLTIALACIYPLSKNQIFTPLNKSFKTFWTHSANWGQNLAADFAQLG
jgi:hypothetical protein